MLLLPSSHLHQRSPVVPPTTVLPLNFVCVCSSVRATHHANLILLNTINLKPDSVKSSMKLFINLYNFFQTSSNFLVWLQTWPQRYKSEQTSTEQTSFPIINLKVRSGRTGLLYPEACSGFEITLKYSAIKTWQSEVKLHSFLYSVYHWDGSEWPASKTRLQFPRKDVPVQDAQSILKVAFPVATRHVRPRQGTARRSSTIRKTSVQHTVIINDLLFTNWKLQC